MYDALRCRPATRWRYWLDQDDRLWFVDGDGGLHARDTFDYRDFLKKPGVLLATAPQQWLVDVVAYTGVFVDERDLWPLRPEYRDVGRLVRGAWSSGAGVYMLLYLPTRHFYVGSAMNLRARAKQWNDRGLWSFDGYPNRRWAAFAEEFEPYIDDWSFLIIEDLRGAPEAYVRAAERRHLTRALRSNRCLNVAKHTVVYSDATRPVVRPAVDWVPRKQVVSGTGWPFTPRAQALSSSARD